MGVYHTMPQYLTFRANGHYVRSSRSELAVRSMHHARAMQCVKP
jgi:hypothetical protein